MDLEEEQAGVAVTGVVLRYPAARLHFERLPPTRELWRHCLFIQPAEVSFKGSPLSVRSADPTDLEWQVGAPGWFRHKSSN